MGKYGQMVQAASHSAEYWTHAAMRNFVRDLAERMEMLGLKKTDIASRLGVSPAYVTKAMRGQTNFTLESMTKLAIAVGATLQVRVVERQSITSGQSWTTTRNARPATTSIAATIGLPASSDAANDWAYSRVRAA